MRDYTPVIRTLGRRGGLVEASADQRMRAVVDALWEAFGGDAGGPVSWVGFYLPADGGEELVLGPRRDKPACSPIGLHGVCGRAFTGGEPVVVADVLDLGEAYVACDPQDRSEVVVPVLAGGHAPCIAVLDLDSPEVAAFDESDVMGLRRVLATAGFDAG